MKKLLLVLLTIFSNQILANSWEKIKKPIAISKPVSIGSYNNGCILGARELPLKGVGYQVIRSDRKRYYGHPNLIKFIKKLSVKTHKANVPTLLIGDMGMPAGGPFTSGHASHQTGLDVDIWLRHGPTKFSYPKPLNVVDHKNFTTNKNWTKHHRQMLKIAASDPMVQRIFINPAVKQKLCTTEKDTSWLRKIRPWNGHNYHFHIRLKCPAGSPKCRKQGNVGKGSGCGFNVTRWDQRTWKKRPKKKIKKKSKKKVAKRKHYKTLPKSCAALVK